MSGVFTQSVKRVEPSATNGHPDGLKPPTTLPAAVSPSPTLPVSKSSFASTLAPGKWTKVFTKLDDLMADVRKKGIFEWRDGWFQRTGERSEMVSILGTTGHNQGIRLHGKIKNVPGQSAPINTTINTMVLVRGTLDSTRRLAYYRLGLIGRMEVPRVLIERYEELVTLTELTSFRLDSPLIPDVEFDMELIAIGDKLYGKFNGKALPVVTDARLTEGEMGFQTRHLARDIEVINLDGLSEAEALKAGGLADVSSSPSPQVPSSPTPTSAAAQAKTPWTKLDLSKILVLDEGQKIRRLENGILHLAGNAGADFKAGTFRDGAIRVTCLWKDDFKTCDAQLRVRQETKNVLRINRTEVMLLRQEGRGNAVVLSRFPLAEPIAAGSEPVFEITAIGSSLYAWCNGRLLGKAENTLLQEGNCGVQTAVEAWIKSLEYLNLDGLSEAEALKAAGIEGK